MKPQPRARPVQKRKNAAPSKPKTNRFWLVVALFALWMGAIAVRLVNLQTTQHEELSHKAAAQRFRERKTKPLRGAILDRTGRELAVTLEVESLAVDPVNLDNIESDGFQLAKLLNRKPKELIVALTDARNEHRQWFPLERELDPALVEKIKSLNLNGLIWTKEQKRSYPNQTLAAHVLGFTNRDDAGQAGIEAAQERNLRGDYTLINEERDGSGRVFESTESVTQLPRNVALTLDSAIQHRVEQALANGVEATKAKAAAAVVLDPKTGEILAMANAPTFDLNDLNKLKPEALTNRAVQSFYEPGSTFKLVTYSTALEENVAKATDTINCSAGAIHIGSRTIRDSSSGGVFDLTTALAKSSNVAAITLGQRIGKERLYEYIRKFGFGATTGVELPVESRGMLSAPDKWTVDTMGSIPIGYEIGVTTLQSAAAFGTIANDGVRIAPHIIKEIREEDGSIFQTAQPENRRVVSVETARQMRQMLRAVTERGTAKRAQLTGYTSAGKTGTAHKYDPQIRTYSGSKFIASFVGFAPVDDPKVVIAVMVDEPIGAHHGGDAAAPIFRDIAEQILPELHVTPDQPEVLTAQTNKDQNQSSAAPIVAMNNVIQPNNSATIENKKTADNKTVDNKSAASAKLLSGEKATQKPAEKPPQKATPAPPKIVAVKTETAREKAVEPKKSVAKTVEPKPPPKIEKTAAVKNQTQPKSKGKT